MDHPRSDRAGVEKSGLEPRAFTSVTGHGAVKVSLSAVAPMASG